MKKLAVVPIVARICFRGRAMSGLETISPLYADVGERIRLLRKRNGINQETLSDRLGYARTSLSNIERGMQRLPLDTLYEIADLLNVTIFDLLPEGNPVRNIKHDILGQEITGVMRSIKALEAIADELKQQQSEMQKFIFENGSE